MPVGNWLPQYSKPWPPNIPYLTTPVFIQQFSHLFLILGAHHWKAGHQCKSPFAKDQYGIAGRVMNIHIQNCSMWLIDLYSKQSGGEDCEQMNASEIFLANLMNINEF